MFFLDRMNRILICIAILLAGMLAAFSASATSKAANPAIYDYRPGVEAAGAGPARPCGSLVPDIALPTLQSYLSPGAPVKTVRLSSYRGKKPLVLIFTTYT